MTSLETIKQELIRQKSLLEKKGFPVPIANRNPTPSEISNAINDIDIKFTETTASEQDVRAGKTFISQTQGIRTGTLDVGNTATVWDIVNKIVSGNEFNMLEAISSDITQIRPYAFYTGNSASKNNFYATDFTLPSYISSVGEYSFSYTNLSGKLVIHENCTLVGKYAFCGCSLTEVEISSGVLEDSYYLFSECRSLKKVTLGPNIKYMTSYMFGSATSLAEIVVRSSQFTWSPYAVYNTSSVKRVIFEMSTPCPMKKNGFQNLRTAMLVVPYLYYDTYFNTTNYQQYSNPMCGYGDFLTGKTLPTEQEEYSLVWYASLDDLLAQTNPVTDCATDGRYYAIFTNTETTTT